MNSKFKVLFDILLVSFIIFMVYFMNQKKNTPKSEWTNSFQELPWKSLQEIKIFHRKFSIQINKSKVFIKYKGISYPSSWSKLQNYLDNLLILPEYKFFEQKEDDLAYGFQKKSIQFIFLTKKYTLKLGKNLNPDRSKFYLSFEDKLFTLPSILRQNIDWPLEYFFSKNPISPNFKKMNLSFQKLQKNPLEIIQKNRQFNLINSKLKLNIFDALQPILTSESKPILSPSFPEKNCQLFLNFDSENIYICDDFFYSKIQKLSWPITSKIQNYLKLLDSKLLSNKLIDYLPFEISQTIKVKLPNHLVITNQDKNFLYLINLLKKSSIKIEAHNDLSLNDSFLFFAKNKQFQMNGKIINNKYFKFHIQNNLYGVLALKKIQSLYQ
ncbi:MAG: hypothetical protein COB02_15565 [Candidatus Cloacimonadota bacterium]|nr:MAG: hypothetical protein COB02_15565 [Candidatus Cloacimonadota bacterium]